MAAKPEPRNGAEAAQTATACVMVLDSIEHSSEYLLQLKHKVGMQWLLVDSGRYLAEILTSGALPIHMFIFDFTQNLTDRVKPYMKICNSRHYREVPVLFFASEDTRKQITQIVERPVDKFLLKPILFDKLTETMGAMLRRAQRRETRLKCWLQLEGRTIEGYTLDISSTGVQIMISDPILYPQMMLDVFFPDGTRSVRFQGRVRRKEKEGGAYKLGVQLQAFVEGPIAEFSEAVQVDFGDVIAAK